MKGVLSSINVRRLLMLENMKTPSSDMNAFREIVKNSKHIVVITGAGVSAESGIPTFRGPQGFWRKFPPQQLATPQAFRKNPSLVWEFYHYRRELVLTKNPNRAHLAIAEFEKTHVDKKVVVVTTNVDELHHKAGTQNLIQLHGSLFSTKCTKCLDIRANYDSPICAALKDKGIPNPDTEDARIPEQDLPRCTECSGLLRPNIVWFGEGLHESDLNNTAKELQKCDLCLVVGTSSIVYPAATFAPQVASRGVPVAEFNLESTPVTSNFGYHFCGPCGDTLPEALAL